MMTTYAAESITGKHKKNNEDRYLIKPISPGVTLLAIADGLGGQPAGEVAAQTAIDALADFMPGSDTLDRDVMNLMFKADRRVTAFSESDSRLEYMGTTLTLALVSGNQVFWSHVGDTRIYHLSRGQLLEITTDQTMANFLVEEGELSLEASLQHPMQSLLEQSLGCGNCEPETGVFHVNHDDIVLLCSDGLYSEISTDDIKNILVMDIDIEEKAALLAKTANDAGGKDNITAVIFQI